MADRVELSINTYVGDLPFLDRSYRHVERQLRAAPITCRRVVVDRRAPTGRFGSSHSASELDAVLEALLTDGLVDVVDEVDWSPSEVSRVAQKYFGDAESPAVASGGSAIHQYLWALDTAASPLVLHFDSDMLIYDPQAGAWVAEAIELMKAQETAGITTPQAGPPRAQTIREWLLGRPSTKPAEGWRPGFDVSTRMYLVDRERLESILPLKPVETGEQLERTISASFAMTGLQRWHRGIDDMWAIHPRRHNDNHEQFLEGLISLVEEGRYPFRRTGYRWDIRTEGRHFLPWRALLLLDSLRRSKYRVRT